MPDHERDCCPLLLGERQELRRKLAHHVAVERHIVRDPEAVEDREQQQRVFGRLSERFSLFDQQTCLLRSRLGFRRGIAFDVHRAGYERDLKLDLLATQRGRGGQGRDLVERTRELLRSFDQRRALQRPLSRLAPEARRLLDQPGLGAVTRQQLGLVLGNLRELAFEGFGDAGMKRAARLAQQRAIGRVLHQRVLEQISCMRRHALPEQQTGRNETVERRLPSSASGLRTTAASSACENSRPIAAPICATSLAEPSRSSRAISEACRLAGTARAGDGTAAAVCCASPSLSASSTAFVISSTNSGMPSVRSMISADHIRR